MSSHTRAVAIGILGPGISLFGLAWVVLDAIFGPTPEAADFRYFIFDSPHLMIAVGTIVSILCVPISIQVAIAEPEEVEMPDFETEFAEFAEADEASEAPAAGDAGYQWSPK